MFHPHPIPFDFIGSLPHLVSASAIGRPACLWSLPAWFDPFLTWFLPHLVSACITWSLTSLLDPCFPYLVSASTGSHLLYTVLVCDTYSLSLSLCCLFYLVHSFILQMVSACLPWSTSACLNYFRLPWLAFACFTWSLSALPGPCLPYQGHCLTLP